MSELFTYRTAEEVAAESTHKRSILTNSEG